MLKKILLISITFQIHMTKYIEQNYNQKSTGERNSASKRLFILSHTRIVLLNFYNCTRKLIIYKLNIIVIDKL